VAAFAHRGYLLGRFQTVADVEGAISCKAFGLLPDASRGGAFDSPLHVSSHTHAIPPYFMQTYGRLCHLVLAFRKSRYQQQGALALWPLPHFLEFDGKRGQARWHHQGRERSREATQLGATAISNAFPVGRRRAQGRT